MSRLEALMGLHAADPSDADLLFMIGNEHLAEGRPQEALEWLARYVQKGGDVGAGYALLADCCVTLGRDAEAKTALRLGIEAARSGGHPTLAGELEERLEEMG